jgi:phospholipid/cholesterol/gamma-HCH transport system substrate-binding protein
MVTQSPTPRHIAIAAAFILASVCLTLFVWRSIGGGLPLQPKGFRFHALFGNASTLQPNADVRIAGVHVGRVISIQPRGLRTDAVIELEPQYAPLSVNARVILRLKSLLGETFVALTPGTRAAAKIPEGGRLATAQVDSTQTLDRVLGGLDARTRRDIDTLIAANARTLRNRSGDVNSTLGNLDPVTAQLHAITAILDRDRGALAGAIRDGGVVTRTLADRRGSLHELIASADDLLGTTAARNAALTATVRHLPTFVRQLDHTSQDLLETSRLAAPTLSRFRPVAPLVAPALRSLRELSPAARSVLRRLRTAIPVVRRALPATAHFVRSLVPFVESLYPVARQIVPTIEMVKVYRRELNATVANVGAGLQGTAPGMNGKPVHYLRSMIPITEEAVVGYPKRLASNRHNAYHAPGELDNLRTGLLASNCANTANPQTIPVIGTGAPPCRVQPPWTFGGHTGYFPQLTQKADTGSHHRDG